MPKSFSSQLAARIGRDKKSTDRLLEALSQTIVKLCGEAEVVAIPGFGSFEAEKHEEQIVTDRSEGKRMLLPPEVVMKFTVASRLRKAIEKRETTERP